MARHEAPREDILAEATALVERVALQMADWPTGPVVIGFRRMGCGSIYFDQDPVYQFNTAGELRRAYLAGLRYKAEGGRLVSLRPERSSSATTLAAHELSPVEQTAALTNLEGHLARLQQRLAEGQYQVAGQSPAGVDLVERSRRWLVELPRPVRVAAEPHAR